MRAALLVVLLAAACETAPKLTMQPQAVVDAMKDYAERGCKFQDDKEGFRTIRDEWDAAKPEIVKNAKLLTGDFKAQYDEARNRFGLCGDGAGLAVFDKW